MAPNYHAFMERRREQHEESSSAQFVNALDLHKERIRRLQAALCECPHRDLFLADLHDETCPVYVIAAAQKRGDK